MSKVYKRKVIILIISTLIAFLSVVVLMGCFCSCSHTSWDAPGWERVESIHLVSLQDDTKLGGTFVFGCGSINESPVYYFYRETAYGYELDWIYAEGVTVVEEGTQEAQLEIWARGWAAKNNYGDAVNRRFVLRVPVGTIVREMTLDLEW